jgi:hypothetical protein
VAVATVVTFLLLAGGARAATIKVTTSFDDLTPNDGFVSLREAIVAFDHGSDLGDPDIVAAQGMQAIDVGSTGNGPLPALTSPVTINGFSEARPPTPSRAPTTRR